MSSQSTLGDDDLFGEAAEEMRSEVEEHLDAVRGSLPDADAIWDTEAQNVLGVLNGLKSALDVEEAEENLRQAKKTFIVGQRADAFEDPDSLESEIASVQELLETVSDAEELVGELTSTMPQLRSQLQEAADAAEERDAASDADADADADDGEDTDEADADAEEEAEEDEE
ncbi:DUF5790 family protein [Halopelagius longus]|uniref:Uncharacterized protein n=1 Tax=Halopelagius longus TaxID=1236180 RepID=A0A1H1DR72_9EURY|nr:DUF5790 family protein [Halopelagius longus]RDI71417.1 hypothetical protein DWB78_06595 [Halopelagius longus]SDQ78376.1 hypothetical protein SAMN05216278_2516 [Halopelagius longus]